MPISVAQAQTSTKKIYGDAASLNPTALITLFEIDTTNLINSRNIVLPDNQKNTTIFRFHNNVKLLSNSIYFNNIEYIAAPIMAEGFEVNSRGTLPTPKLSLTVNQNGISLLAVLKYQLAQLGDLTGAKVTRIRTFAKYLDAARNFPLHSRPDWLEPDPNAYFPPDVFYIDRKSNENKFSIEFELASILDVEGIRLPGRIVSAKRCVASYRGEGCCYEYSIRANPDVHESAILPVTAPPIATENDELISTILGATVTIKEPEEYKDDRLNLYKKGQSVYITRNGLNYYFVASTDTVLAAPPNLNYWIADQCSHLREGCSRRWGSTGSANVTGTGLTLGQLPFVGFPGADKIS